MSEYEVRSYFASGLEHRPRAGRTRGAGVGLLRTQAPSNFAYQETRRNAGVNHSHHSRCLYVTQVAYGGISPQE